MWGRLAVMAGSVEEGRLKSVVIRVCATEAEAREELAG